MEWWVGCAANQQRLTALGVCQQAAAFAAATGGMSADDRAGLRSVIEGRPLDDVLAEEARDMLAAAQRGIARRELQGGRA